MKKVFGFLKLYKWLKGGVLRDAFDTEEREEMKNFWISKWLKGSVLVTLLTPKK